MSTPSEILKELKTITDEVVKNSNQQLPLPCGIKTRDSRVMLAVENITLVQRNAKLKRICQLLDELKGMNLNDIPNHELDLLLDHPISKLANDEK